MDKNDKWATESIKENPYWTDGMSPEEYDMERRFYLTYYEEIRTGQMEYVKPNKRKVVKDE